MKTRKGKRYLQQHQIDYLQEHHKKLTAAQMAKALGCSKPTLSRWYRKLYIKPNKGCFQYEVPLIPPCEPPKII